MRRVLPLAVVVVVLLAAAPAHAAFSGASNGTIATLTGDGAHDSVTIDASGGLLRHSSLAGFNSDFDWDDLPGDQTLGNTTGTTLNIDAGGGNDTIVLGSGAFGAGDLVARIAARGQANRDVLEIVDNGPARTVGLSSNAVTGLGGAKPIAGIEGAILRLGPGDDTLSPALDPATPGALLFGGGGTDTLSYAAWTAPVNASLGVVRVDSTELSSANTVPPNTSEATGTGVLTLSADATHADVALDVSGLAGAGTIQGTSIHRAEPGSNGPIFVALPLTWSGSGSGPRSLRVSGVPVSPTLLQDLYAGRLYFAIRTAAFASGEVRGQLERAGTGGVAVARLEGGAGDDALTGSSAADTLLGNAGADLLVGLGGADTLRAGDGDDTLRADDGATDVALDCGAGNDVAVRDASTIDPDSIATTPAPAPDPSPTFESSGNAATAPGRRGALIVFPGVRAVCPALASGPCTGTAKLTAKVKKGRKRRTVTLGTQKLTVTPGSAVELRISISRAKARNVKKKLSTTLQADIKTPSGRSATTRRTVRVQSARNA